MRYHGSCHCGKVAFDVEGELTEVMACNCSMCSRRGSLLWFVPRSQFTLQQGEESLATYTFNKNRIKHHFCTTCGIHPFAEALDPKGVPTAAINVRSLENVDIESVRVTHFDGLHKL